MVNILTFLARSETLVAGTHYTLKLFCECGVSDTFPCRQTSFVLTARTRQVDNHNTPITHTTHSVVSQPPSLCVSQLASVNVVVVVIVVVVVVVVDVVVVVVVARRPPNADHKQAQTTNTTKPAQFVRSFVVRRSLFVVRSVRWSVLQCVSASVRQCHCTLHRCCTTAPSVRPLSHNKPACLASKYIATYYQL